METMVLNPDEMPTPEQSRMFERPITAKHNSEEIIAQENYSDEEPTEDEKSFLQLNYKKKPKDFNLL